MAALAIGDFDANGYADLAASADDVPSPKCYFTDEETECPDGVVVMSSSRAGLDVDGAKLWSADTSGVAGRGERGDGFGAVLAAGDLNRDGRDDLAIGVPRKGVGDVLDTGGVTMLYGSSRGLTAAGSQIWTQDSPRVPGINERGDGFGTALLISALRGRTGNGLTIAVPYESVGTSRPRAGVATVLFGIRSGVTANRATIWSQSSPGVPGAAEEGDTFGYPRAGRRVTSAAWGAAGSGSADLRVDRRRPGGPADQAERVAGRVGVDVVAAEGPGPERDDRGIGRLEVVDHDVEMHLLGYVGLGPARRAMVDHQLEGETGGLLVAGDHDEVRGAVGHRQTEQLRPEPGQRLRIRAVDDEVVQAADHVGSVPRPGRAGRQPVGPKRSIRITPGGTPRSGQQPAGGVGEAG